MNKIIFFTLILILSSCSKKETGTPAKLKLLSSAITAGLTTAGGALITGKSSTGDAFQMGLQLGSEATDIELSPGSWEFSAITWENENGHGPMTGTNRCALTSANIEGEEVVVNLNLSPATCADSHFSSSTNLTGNQFNKLRIVACHNFEGVSDSSSTACQNPLNMGSNLSYRIMFKGKNLANNTDLSSLASACISPSVLSTSEYITFNKLPLNSNGNFPFLILAYEDLNCEQDDLEATYLFQGGGLQVGGISESDSLIFSGPSVEQTTFFMADNYVGTANNTFANSGMLPPHQDFNYRYDDPIQSSAGGNSYENTREQFLNIVGPTNMIPQWTLGSKAKATFQTNVMVETTNTTSAYNGMMFNVTDGGAECAVSSTLTTSPLAVNITFCAQIDSIPTFPKTEDIVSAINNALTSGGLAGEFTVTNLDPGTTVSSATITTQTLDYGWDPESPWRRDTGKYGEIASALYGHLGAILAKAGYETCSEIPTTGSTTFQINQNDIVEFKFSTGKIPMSEWMDSAGSYPAMNVFEKRVAFVEEGQIKEFYEFNCTGNVLAGFYRSNHIDSQEDYRIEAYWDAQTSTTLKFEYLVFDKRNETGNNYERRQWSYLQNSSDSDYFELWLARNYNNISGANNTGDVYVVKVDGSNVHTSSRNYTAAELSTEPIDFATNTPNTQKYNHDGSIAGATGHSVLPPFETPSPLAMNNVQFSKLIDTVPNNMAPMSMNDSRLFLGYGPNMTYQAYKRTMNFFDDWNSVNTSIGCFSTLGTHTLFLLGDNSSLFTDSASYVYANNLESIYNMTPSPLQSNGCSSLDWTSLYSSITIDELSFKNYDGTATLPSLEYLGEGVTFEFSIPRLHNGILDTFSNTLITTNEPVGGGLNGGSLRLFGDQVYAPLAPSTPLTYTASTGSFSIPVSGIYPGAIVTVTTDGITPPNCTLIQPLNDSVDCTPPGDEVAGDKWTIIYDNSNIGQIMTEFIDID